MKASSGISPVYQSLSMPEANFLYVSLAGDAILNVWSGWVPSASRATSMSMARHALSREMVFHDAIVQAS